jgi:hypothetical protein
MDVSPPGYPQGVPLQFDGCEGLFFSEEQLTYPDVHSLRSYATLIVLYRV